MSRALFMQPRYHFWLRETTCFWCSHPICAKVSWLCYELWYCSQLSLSSSGTHACIEKWFGRRTHHQYIRKEQWATHLALYISACWFGNQPTFCTRYTRRGCCETRALPYTNLHYDRVIATSHGFCSWKRGSSFMAHSLHWFNLASGGRSSHMASWSCSWWIKFSRPNWVRIDSWWVPFTLPSSSGLIGDSVKTRPTTARHSSPFQSTCVSISHWA